jgi:uroporphyrinogen-III synthase
VTRPAAQAEPFCAMLAAAGARVSRFPVIEIQGPNDPGRLGAVLDALSDFDIAVFVSANAVQRVLPAALARGAWPAQLRVAAIGARTALELQDHGRAADIVPGSRFDSEALLQEPALQDLTGRKVVIFRGDGGREHLAETLQERGAEVTYAEAYRRAIPDLDPEPLEAQLKAGRHRRRHRDQWREPAQPRRDGGAAMAQGPAADCAGRRRNAGRRAGTGAGLPGDGRDG